MHCRTFQVPVKHIRETLFCLNQGDHAMVSFIVENNVSFYVVEFDDYFYIDEESWEEGTKFLDTKTAKELCVMSKIHLEQMNGDKCLFCGEKQ